MKNLYLRFALIACFMVCCAGAANAQCLGCAVNSGCVIPGGGLCPDSLPAGTVALPYSEDLTFYLPPQIDASAFSGGLLGMVPLVSVHIDAVGGMPFGLDWTANNPTNMYYPAAGENHGCVKVCGTPLGAAGVYNVTVYVTAVVDAGSVLGNQTAQVTFPFQMVLLPSASGNFAFSYTPSSACDSGTFTFQPLLNATLPQVVEYEWTYGNQTHTGPTPPSQFFNTPGDYAVTCTTRFYDLQLTALNVTLNGCWFAGDIEEANCGNGNADMFFLWTTGPGTYTSSSGSNSPNASWSNLSVMVTSTVYSLTIMEDDNGSPFGSPDDNGGTTTGIITGPGTYPFVTTAVSGGGGGTSGSFTIGQVFNNEIIITDTVHVDGPPPALSITPSAPGFCPGDSVVLTVLPGYSYEWYRDSVVVANGSANTYVAHTGGVYWVKIFGPTGCTSLGPATTISAYSSIPANFAITWDVPNNRMKSSLTGTFSYQWQFFNGTSWTAIPAPAGVQSYYAPTANGDYRLIATNGSSCTDTSAVFAFNSLGINDPALFNALSLYPNPSDGAFTISMDLPEAADVSVTILDMTGRQVYSRNLGNISGMQSEYFTLYDLNAGSYIADIRFNEMVVRKKLVIQ